MAIKNNQGGIANMFLKSNYEHNISEFLIMFLVIILFVWISFFPVVLQERYYFSTQVFLLLIFLDTWIRKGNSIFKRADFALWVFIILVGLNVLFTRQINVAFVTYLKIALPLILIYYIISENFSREKSFDLLAKAISILSILVSFIGLFEVIFAFNPIYEYFIKNQYYKTCMTGFVRPISTQFTPAPLGGYLVSSLPFNLLLFKRNKSFWRVIGEIGIVANIVIIFLTFSRGAFLALITTMALYLFAQRNFALLRIFLAIVLIFIFISSIFPYPLNRYSLDYIFGEKSSAMLSPYRLARYSMVSSILKDHPFVGIGFQHVRIRFYEYYPLIKNVSYETRILDNMYLTILAETGIIGFLGFTIFIFYFIKEAWRKLKKLNFESWQRWYLLVGITSLIAILIDMHGFEFMYWLNPYLYFCIIIGCLAALCKISPAQ